MPIHYRKSEKELPELEPFGSQIAAYADDAVVKSLRVAACVNELTEEMLRGEQTVPVGAATNSNYNEIPLSEASRYAKNEFEVLRAMNGFSEYADSKTSSSESAKE